MDDIERINMLIDSYVDDSWAAEHLKDDIRNILNGCKYADIAKPDVIPSMSTRIDENSFKNGYKPGELAVPLPKGPLDGYKSMSSVKLSAIHDNPTMASAQLTIENGDTNRMRRKIKASSACEAMGMEVD